MPYDNEKIVIPYIYAPWYKVDLLIKAIADIRKINYSITEQRNQALQRLNTLQSTNPFANGRFNHTGLYICETYGDWSRKFAQLRNALSYKEPSDAFRALSTDKNIASDQKSIVQRFNDSSLSFGNVLIDMITQINKLDGVFNRESFELTFDVIWSSAKPKKQQGAQGLVPLIADDDNESQHSEEEANLNPNKEEVGQPNA
jgi:hypothetical protein